MGSPEGINNGKNGKRYNLYEVNIIMKNHTATILNALRAKTMKF